MGTSKRLGISVPRRRSNKRHETRPRTDHSRIESTAHLRGGSARTAHRPRPWRAGRPPGAGPGRLSRRSAGRFASYAASYAGALQNSARGHRTLTAAKGSERRPPFGTIVEGTSEVSQAVEE